MFEKEDKTYDELRKKSIEQWLNDMSYHKDIEVRGGVRVTQGYIVDLERKINSLEQKNELKDKYLHKMKLVKDRD